MIAQISAVCAALSRQGKKATPAKVEPSRRPVLVVCQAKACNYAFEGISGEVCPRCHEGIGLKTLEKGTY
jgi:hypothetical protein